MREYENHIFYNTDKLKLSDKIKVLIDAKKLCYEWWVDILDCNISFSRQKIEMSFEEVIKKLKNNSHFTIIYRKGFYEPHTEIGFCTMDSPSHFLWINVKEEKLKFFIKKYKLIKK